MTKYQILNATQSGLITENASMADHFIGRFKGLMGQNEMAEDDCLIIKPCNQIHMFFMKFAIDAVYLDADFRVCAIDHGLMPWKVGTKKPGARMVLEFRAGFVNNRIQINDVLVLNHVENIH